MIKKSYFNRIITNSVLLIALFLTFSSKTQALEPTWSVDFGSVFDNREGDDKMYDDKTFFFTTLSAEGGVKFTKKDRIAGGAVWIQPLENGIRDSRLHPILYYRHEGENWKFSMGMFPRTQLREPLPGFIWCDSLTYYQKNIRGALLQYQREEGFFDAYIDWRAHQTETRREAFNLMFHGEWRPKAGKFLIGAHLLMNHFAKTRHPSDDQSIVDNFLANPYVGIDMSRKTVLDSLVVKAGLLQTIERNRGNDKGWVCPGGLWVDAVFEWKRFGLKNSLFVGGEGLLPLYSEFGTQLYQGESYYRSNFYNRTDVYARIIRNRYMDLEAQLNFNFAKNNFMFYQRLILNIHIGNI